MSFSWPCGARIHSFSLSDLQPDATRNGIKCSRLRLAVAGVIAFVVFVLCSTEIDIRTSLSGTQNMIGIQLILNSCFGKPRFDDVSSDDVLQGWPPVHLETGTSMAKNLE